MPSAIYKPRNLQDIRTIVRSHRPRVVVFCGRHEPYEPSRRILRMPDPAHGGRMLYSHYTNPAEVLLLALPESYRPLNFSRRLFDILLANSQEILVSEEQYYAGFEREESTKLASAFLAAWERIKTGRSVLVRLKQKVSREAEGEQRHAMLGALDEAFNNLHGEYSAQGLLAALVSTVASKDRPGLSDYARTLSDSLPQFDKERCNDFGNTFDRLLAGHYHWRGRLFDDHWLPHPTRLEHFRKIHDTLAQNTGVVTDDELHQLLLAESPPSKQINLHFSSSEKPSEHPASPTLTQAVTLELAGLRPHLECRLLDEEASKAVSFFSFVRTLMEPLKITDVMGQGGEEYIASSAESDLAPFHAANIAAFHDLIERNLNPCQS